MTDNQTPAAEAVDVERLDHQIQVEMDATGNPFISFDGRIVLALLSRLKAAEHRAAELAAQNAGLENALDGVHHALSYTLPMAKGYAHAHPVGGNQDKIEGGERALEFGAAALATTPAEALAVVREMQAALATEIMMHGMHGNKCTSDAADAARRLFGSAR